MPTKRLALALAFGAVFWALGLFPFAWAYNAIILIAALWEWWAVRVALRRLKVERELPIAFEIGSAQIVRLAIENPAPFPLVIDIKDEPPSDFTWEAQGKGEHHLRPMLIISVPTKHRIVVSYTVTPMRRGEFAFGDFDIRARTIFGLVQLFKRMPLPQKVLVMPNLSQARKYEILMRKMKLREFGFRLIPLKGVGTEFASLRDYLPDDDPRWIDWNATARKVKLVSKEFELERGQSIVAILDSGRVMATKLNKLTKFDHAVNTAAFLLYLAYRLDDKIGLMIFAERVLRWLPPQKGKRQWEVILQALREAEPKLVEAEYANAFVRLLQGLPRRSLIVLFTDLIDPDTSEALLSYARLLAEKHIVIVVALSDYELRVLLSEEPKEAMDLYRHSAAIATINERLRAITQLRESGITVLDTTPQALFSALAEQYLIAKRRL